MRTLVAGAGNIFLGDDAFGVEVLGRLGPDDFPPGTRLYDAGIAGIHLAHELLEGYDALVLIDCMPGGGQPGAVSVYEVAPGSEAASAHRAPAAFANAHGFQPHVALDMVEAMGGTLGRVFVVGCEPASLEPGMQLSEPVVAALDRAADEVRALVRQLHASAEDSYEEATNAAQREE